MRYRLPTIVRAGLLLGLAALLLALELSPGTSRSSEPYPAVPAAQPVIGAPAFMTLVGSSPAEAAGETWGYSILGGFSIVRYISETGTWHVYIPPLNGEGRPLEGFTPAAGPLAGSATPAGGVAIVGQDAAHVEQVLVRDPGGPFQEAPAPTDESTPTQRYPPLKQGETLAASSREGVLMSAVEQPGNHTGVFLVPYESASASVQNGVIFYDGKTWTREAICEGVGAGPCKAPASGFKVLAIGASSPQNAWLLAKTGSGTEGISLFAREAGGSGAPLWHQRSLGGSPFAQANPPVKEASVNVSALPGGQPLTVTSQGVWVDGTLTVAPVGEQRQNDSFTLFYDPNAATVAASWCDAPAAAASLCTRPLGAQLPAGPYRSFAWSGGGPFGRRVITGLSDGVSLSLRGEAFTRVLGAGGAAGTEFGAAFSSPEEGWLAQDGPLTHLTRKPAPDQVGSWPVPFRRPLTAIAEQPGASGGELGAQALAVGSGGQVARYVPGRGWAPEALLSSAGIAQLPNLRGVAWPTPNRAYAVGSGGAMWLWRAETGLWEPDPARPPNLYLANLTGVAFDPINSTRGYAIGQQGVLLRYGKTWIQEALPPGLEGADLTSITFVGHEALVTYQIPHFNPAEGYGYSYSGGLLVNDGSGWRVDAGAATALGHRGVPVRVAGLPDGGAVMADAEGDVFERQGPGSPWQPSPAGTAGGFPVALAAFREGGVLRAVVSMDTTGAGDLSDQYHVDEALQQPPPPGQAPIATSPYPLPGGGALLRETPNGWRDEEHQDYPTPAISGGLPPGETGVDWPDQPDAVLALALAPDGGQGWAVGGQTGEINRNSSSTSRIQAIQTAGVMRYPASGAAPVGFTASPVPTGAGDATFAIGGNAQCAAPCADLAQDQLGPDAWLSNALARAGQTPGVRAFLYTGSHLAPGLAQATDAAGFQREADRYAELLASSGGPPAVFAAPSASDLDGAGTLATFASVFSSFGSPFGSGPAPAGVTPVSPASPSAGMDYYSFESTGTGGRVRVVVLDYSGAALGAAQQCWLAGQLAAAKAAAVPAIVVGNRALDAVEEEVGKGSFAADAGQVIPILVSGTPPVGCATGLPAGGASAYFYDAPQQNREFQLTAGGASIPAFGSGTLGYITPPLEGSTDFLGASGFLLAEVQVAKRNPATNRAPVSVRLIPDISDLALDATNGVLLRRSQPALFDALARRPHAGMFCREGSAACEFQPDPYVPIPSLCAGPACATGILPYYTFTSSNPDIGDFVKPDPASSEGTTVLQGPGGKPIPDEHSGLFCAYNAGTTTVTLEAGGLASSLQVTIQPGSVEQPCGTVPLRNPPAPSQQAALPVPVPAPSPTPAASPRGTLAPPPPPPPATAQPAATPILHVPPRAAALPPVPQALAQLYPILPLVPPPAPAAARPTPPSGTAQVPAQSPVSQPVGVAEEESEEQGATEVVHHMAAYGHRPAEAPLPAWPLALVLAAAAAGVGLRRPRPQLARARTGHRTR